ncbi:MAG: PEP-CTERM sorting domain-containing protein [Gammaproteobacteria bacterium]|nr:PEP-CTERM sorting domain-containing protein [Gammaproteobacteria bacterium]
MIKDSLIGTGIMIALSINIAQAATISRYDPIQGVDEIWEFEFIKSSWADIVDNQKKEVWYGDKDLAGELVSLMVEKYISVPITDPAYDFGYDWGIRWAYDETPENHAGPYAFVDDSWVYYHDRTTPLLDFYADDTSTKQIYWATLKSRTTVSPVPVPGALFLFGIGLAGIGVFRKMAARIV